MEDERIATEQKFERKIDIITREASRREYELSRKYISYDAHVCVHVCVCVYIYIYIYVHGGIFRPPSAVQVRHTYIYTYIHTEDEIADLQVQLKFYKQRTDEMQKEHKIALQRLMPSCGQSDLLAITAPEEAGGEDLKHRTEMRESICVCVHVCMMCVGVTDIHIYIYIYIYYDVIMYVGLCTCTGHCTSLQLLQGLISSITWLRCIATCYM